MMHKKSLFRSQACIRAFAFACAGSSLGLAGCASDGSVKPSTQQQLTQACSDTSMALSLASFVVKTPVQQTLVSEAQTTEAQFCSPSALAADLTPLALAANVQALEQAITDLNAMTGAKAPEPASGVLSTQ